MIVFSDEYFENELIELKQVNEESTTKNDLISEDTTSTGTRSTGKLSSWRDNFDDGSKIDSALYLSQESGNMSLSIINSQYSTTGTLVSEPIEPAGPCIWKTFNAAETEIQYKRVIKIDNTLNTNNLQGYAIPLTLDTSTLISGGKMKADGGDIRFYDIDGNKFPYWVESGLNTAQTKIWVNITSIPASVVSYIYMDYGNPGLVSESSGDATFLFFESFEDAPGYNPNYWKAGGPDQAFVFSRSTDQVLDGSYALKAEMSASYDYMNLNHRYSTPMIDKVISLKFYDDTSFNNIALVDLQIGKGTDWSRIRTNVLGGSQYAFEYWNGAQYDTKIKTRNTGWHEINAMMTGSDITFYLDGALAGNRPITNYISSTIAYSANWGLPGTQYFDEYYFREYSKPEPTITVGPEPTTGSNEIVFKILNASNDSELMTVTDGQDISGINADSIKLKAEFSSNGGGTPFLDEWSVEWNTLPVFEDVICSEDSIFRTQSSIICTNTTDVEDIEDDLIVVVEHKSPSDTAWQKTYLSPISFLTDFTRCIFTPSSNAELGLYYFRYSCSDSTGDTTIYSTEFTIEVKNNKPSKPYLEITPGNPRTTNDLTIIATNIHDIETNANDLELWYTWYRNGTHVPEFNNITVIAKTNIGREQNWMVKLRIFDGDEFGPINSTSVIIANSPPLLLEQFDTFVMNEDESIVLENKLLNIFSDDDLDELNLLSTGQTDIITQIFPENGTIMFNPKANWSGTETITFYANDSKIHALTEVTVTVKPINDLPVITQIGSQIIIDPDIELEFMVEQDDTLKLPVTVTDIDGDVEKGMIKYVFNFTERENLYFNNSDKSLVFQPKNSDCGYHYYELMISDNNETPIEYVTQRLKIYVINVNDQPTIEITSPDTGFEFYQSDEVIFTSKADDLDLLITDSTERLTYRWYIRTPEIVELGTERELVNPKLPVGDTTLTVEVKDASNATATDSILITVKEDKSTASGVFASSYLWMAVAVPLVIIMLIILFVVIPRRKRKEEAIHPDVVAPVEEAPAEVPLAVAAATPAETLPTAEPAAAAVPAALPTAQPADTVKTYSMVEEKQAGIDASLSADQKLKLLEERLLRGDMDQNLYESLKAKFETEAGIRPPAPAAPGPAPRLPPTETSPPAAPTPPPSVQVTPQPEPQPQPPQPQVTPQAAPQPAQQTSPAPAPTPVTTPTPAPQEPKPQAQDKDIKCPVCNTVYKGWDKCPQCNPNQ
jgi:hypothetical protein